MNTEQYMDLKQLVALLRISRQTIERLMKSGNFPQKIYITPRRIRWLRNEVEAWQRSKETGRTQIRDEQRMLSTGSWIPIQIDSRSDNSKR
jgi:predicted DNA-binding transcriptional regulator AlpA